MGTLSAIVDQPGDAVRLVHVIWAQRAFSEFFGVVLEKVFEVVGNAISSLLSKALCEDIADSKEEHGDDCC